MRIIDLHIYGFGRFENEFIQFEETEVQAIYGENESGKSTVMAFIEYMLFGFPKRSEKRLRYEPKTTQAYGGKLRIETAEHGFLTIERKGDASGTVTIVKEDGSNEGEAFLQQVLGEVNHQTFRDVFSFNLDGLQKVNEIKSEQIGEYLFNAGLTGAQQLNQISKSLEEQQNRLFKPNGKNPVLNQKLNHLHELEQKVKQWSKKLDEYNRMKSELEDKREALSKSERAKNGLDQKRTELKHLQSINPLLEQKNTIENQLKSLPTAVPFPEEGLDRFQSLKERQIELHSDRKHVEDLIRKNKEVYDAIYLNDEMLDHAPRINELESNFRLYKGRQEDYSKLNERIEYLQQEIDNEMQVIGQKWTEETIRSINTDLVTKQQLISKLKRLDQSEEEQKRLDEDLLNARGELEENEAKRTRLKEQMLPEGTIQSYRVKVEDLSSQSPELLKGRIETLKSLQSASKGNSINGMIIWAMIGLGIVLTGMWMMQGDYIAGLIIGISLVGAGILLNKKGGLDNEQDLKRQITELEAELRNHQDSNDVSELDHLNQLLNDQQQLAVQLDHLKDHEQALAKRYQDVARRYDQWEIKHHQTVEELSSWREMAHIPPNVPDELLLEIFERIDHLKKRLTERSHLKKRLAQLQTELSKFESAVRDISRACHIDSNHGIEQNLSQLSRQLKEQMKKREEKYSLAVSIEELQEQYEGLLTKYTKYTDEIEILFTLAEVEGEETFREKGKANERYEKWTEQLQMVDAQLQASTDWKIIEHLENDPSKLSNLQARLEKLDEELETTNKDIDMLRDDCSRLQAAITHLEEDGTYSNQLHSYHLAKSEFIEEAKKWAVYRTAQYVLDRAKQNYQSERQPRVIKRAAGYFTVLTEGEYNRIIAPKGEESFLIERKDRVVFKPEELSRATMEQLYLSLRFALAEEYENQGDFPLIMDDILVNFDEKRRNLACKLIRSIAEERQVLYFTCHGNAVAYLTEKPLQLPDRASLEVQTY
ncbi:AAA family ATPase [Alkalihalobacillus sp. TS-13]|uniref:ATP-binding protein n=1 Tax=Alkalihalobacillus sp. TS-13 TaxID=2842455 RepID=UPI001C87D3CC|nr:AAA family ATPase [Alkalihalobacillus sp. TS-13]